VEKKPRCPDCAAVLRRLYHQTGGGRRRFVGCGWTCYGCGYVSTMERPKE